MARRAIQQPGLPVIRFVRVDPDSRRYEKTILAEMEPLVGKPLDLDAVGARITDLYGLGYFETLDYTVVAQGRGPGPGVRARGACAPQIVGPELRAFRAGSRVEFPGQQSVQRRGRVPADGNRRPRGGAADERADRERLEDHERVLPAARCAGEVVRGSCRAPRVARSADLPEQFQDRRLPRSRGGGRPRCRPQSRQLGRDPRRTAPDQRLDVRLFRQSRSGRPAVQQRRVFLQVQLRPARQRPLPARRPILRHTVGRQSHQSGRGHGLRSSLGRLAGGGLARPQHAAALDLGRRDPGRQAQATRTCRISIRSAASSTCRASRRNPCSDPTTR